MIRVMLAAAALFAVVLFAFGEVRSFGFLDYDDGDYVFRNLHLLQGSAAERVQWAFTTFHAANWHPLTWLSFMSDQALFGLDPRWCHRENLLLHGLAALKRYGRAAALQPDAAEPRVRLGRLLGRLGRREEAMASCREALRLDPGSAGAADCLSEAGALPAGPGPP
jgi:tetratricopeptide (TPR) repeat protein